MTTRVHTLNRAFDTLQCGERVLRKGRGYRILRRNKNQSGGTDAIFVEDCITRQAKTIYGLPNERVTIILPGSSITDACRELCPPGPSVSGPSVSSCPACPEKRGVPGEVVKLAPKTREQLDAATYKLGLLRLSHGPAAGGAVLAYETLLLIQALDEGVE